MCMYTHTHHRLRDLVALAETNIYDLRYAHTYEHNTNLYTIHALLQVKKSMMLQV